MRQLLFLSMIFVSAIFWPNFALTQGRPEIVPTQKHPEIVPTQEHPDIVPGECPENAFPTVVHCGRAGANPTDGKQVDCFIIMNCMGRFSVDAQPTGNLKCSGKTVEGNFEISDYVLSFVPRTALAQGSRCVLEIVKSSVKLSDSSDFRVDNAELNKGRYKFSFVTGKQEILGEASL